MQIGSPARTLARVALAAALYLAAGRAGLLLAVPPGFATAVWPASGIAFVLTFVWGPWMLPGVWLGSFLTNLRGLSDPGLAALALPALIGLGAAAHAGLAAWLVRRAVGVPLRMDEERGTVRALVLAGPVASLVSALNGVAALWLFGVLAQGDLGRNLATWWVGDAIGVLAVAPIVLAFVGRPRELWRPRRSTVALPLAIIYGLVIGFSLFASDAEEERVHAGFDAEAAELVRRFELSMHDYEQALRGVERFYASSARVDRDEFASFVGYYLRAFPGIQALEWIPLVQDVERARFEAAVRAAGYPDFRILERAPDGGALGPAGERDVYAPVTYVEPLVGNEAAFGYDVASQEVRREALLLARDTGEAAVTGPIRLVQDPQRQTGFLIFLPIYRTGASLDTVGDRRESILGFATGVFRVGDIAGSVLGAGPADGVRFVVEDVEAGALLFESAPGPEPSARPSVHGERVDVAGRPWDVRVEAARSYLAARHGWGAWGILAGGLTLAGLVGAILLAMTGGVWRVRRLVEEQTRDLREAKETAEGALRVKGAFLANMSHEIRTPMNAILGMTELMLAGDLDPRHKDELQVVRSSGETLLHLLDDILDLSKMDAGRFSVSHEPFPLGRLVKDVVRMMGNRASAKGVALEHDLAPELPERVTGDARRIRQVLFNLIGNAIKFTDEGTVRVCVEPDADGWVAIHVDDTGPGLPEERIPVLFEPFTQADASTTRVYGGTGLGLHISRRLVELMGGRIEAMNREGGGARFSFRLPLPEAASSAPAAGTAAQVQESHAFEALAGEPRVLLVEDNPVNQMVARRMLEKLGCRVEVAENGAVALEKADPDLAIVIMDMQMPVMDGFEATRRLKARPGWRVPVIAMTASALDEDRRRCEEAGLDDFVSKPVRPEVLREVLSRWVSG